MAVRTRNTWPHIPPEYVEKKEIILFIIERQRLRRCDAVRADKHMTSNLTSSFEIYDTWGYTLILKDSTKLCHHKDARERLMW